jgi:hypothetical protein
MYSGYCNSLWAPENWCEGKLEMILELRNTSETEYIATYAPASICSQLSDLTREKPGIRNGGNDSSFNNRMKNEDMIHTLVATGFVTHKCYGTRGVERLSRIVPSRIVSEWLMIPRFHVSEKQKIE